MSSKDGLSEDVVDHHSSMDRDVEEMTRLIQDLDEGKRKSYPSRTGSSSSPTPSAQAQETRRQTSTTRTSSSDSVSNAKRDSSSSHHSYHFRRKLANFRSDSVFSDVMPIASSSTNPDPQQISDSCEKGGGGSRSLSSLKQKESKWISLRKKLKINSGGSISKKSEGQKEEETSTETVDSTAPLKSLNSKRSLFQRAKTLALIPVGRGRDSSEEPKPERNRQNRKQQVIQEPKELFNVGGEMNLIPLELLIDINDLQLEPK